MDGQTKKSGKLLWVLTVIVAIVLGLLASVFTIGTIVHFETKDVILKDHNTERDRKLEAEERELFSEDGVTVTFLGFNKSSSPFGNTIDFEIENRSSKEVSLSYDYLKVNGYVVKAVMSERVPANSTAKAQSTINTVFREIGIDRIEEIAFGLRLYNGDYLTYGEYRIPTNYAGSVTGMPTYSNRKEIVRETTAQGNIRISLLPDLTIKQDDGEKFYVLIENETDTPIRISTEAVVFNGTTVKQFGFMPEPLPPHSKSVEPVDIDLAEDIAKLVGNEIQTLELLLDIRDEEKHGNLFEFENVSMKLK